MPLSLKLNCKEITVNTKTYPPFYKTVPEKRGPFRWLRLNFIKTSVYININIFYSLIKSLKLHNHQNQIQYAKFKKKKKNQKSIDRVRENLQQSGGGQRSC